MELTLKYTVKAFTLLTSHYYHSQQYLVEIKNTGLTSPRTKVDVNFSQLNVLFLILAAAVRESDQSASDNQERESGDERRKFVSGKISF